MPHLWKPNLVLMLFIVITALSADIAQANCLDISGTYDLGIAGEGGHAPKLCGPAQAQLSVKKSWYKISQTACSDVQWAKVLKLSDNSFCEIKLTDYIVDGGEHPFANQITYATYVYTMTDSKHVTNLKAVDTGDMTTAIHYLDASGGLVSDYQYKDGTDDTESFPKSPVQ